jgi:putative hemolysin
VYFAGGNSSLFRAVGRLHPLLRTALLPREMWAQRGRTIAVRVGAPVLPDELGAVPDSRGRTELLRERATTLSVAHRGRTEDLVANIEALHSEVLLESGSYQVFCASAPQLPAVLPEIGRLRELAFRQAGEGTGLSRDLDRFDETYQHLFVWDRVQREIAGAYRLGATDVVAAEGCVEGLYTRTLFDYDAALLDEIGPALELGRSFVHPGYQRDFSPLLLLWKGISRFVVRSGRYRRLFGVVSVSDRYDSISRQLLVKFLQTHRFDADLGRLVRARNPPPPSGDRFVQAATVDSIEDVSALIRQVERDGKDIPVLLRQYLKLNAKLLGFTVDYDFGNVLDGLLVVDLAGVEPAILSRYMGRAAASAFLKSLRPTTSAGADVRTRDRAASGALAGLDAVAP